MHMLIRCICVSYISLVCKLHLSSIFSAYYPRLLFPGSINYVIKKTSFLSYFDSVAMIDCSFFYCQSFYCMVCCSTDPSVPPDSSVYNISTNRGTEVTVSLQGLPSGQMYYCKAAATNTNSNNCAGPVVGGVKLLFSFMAYPSSTSNVSNAGMSIYLPKLYVLPLISINCTRTKQSHLPHYYSLVLFACITNCEWENK